MGVHETALQGFGRGAAAYERGRPGYPKDAIDWISERLGIGNASRVVDLGAGTGKFTRLLQATGATVFALEPSAEMRAEFTRVLPAVTLLNATARSIPLPDGSVDAVTAAQSFHWFATDRVLAELQRVLRSQGGLGLIWNRREMTDPMQIRLEEIIAPYRAGTPGHESDRWMDTMRTTSRFEPIGERQFSYEQQLDRCGLIDRVLSISFIALLDPSKRDGVVRDVEAAAGDATEFVLPYRTEVYLYRRADS